jgi:hypothetical protein
MTVAIAQAEVTAINMFVKTLGCETCDNLTNNASVCAAAFVKCGELAGRYSLNLSGRNLTGRIDGDMWELMPNCIRLFLEQNSLTGSLPPALLGPSSALSLILNYNRLSGTLPETPTSTALQDFRVSGNQLEGTIPLGYFSLPRIVRLHLNNNRFSGDFPRPPVGASQSLDNFFAGGNQFTGSIGLEWRRLTPNQPLLFQGYSNRLNGTIPDLFATHQFAYFNFDNNALSGTIPSSISRQSALTHLNISNNLLSGTFSAPRVRDFCVIDHNQFDSCIEKPARCCRAFTTNTTVSFATIGQTSTGSDSSQTLDSTAPSDAYCDASRQRRIDWRSGGRNSTTAPGCCCCFLDCAQAQAAPSAGDIGWHSS